MIYNTLNQSTTTEISSEGLFHFLKKWKRGASLPTLLKKTFPPPKKKNPVGPTLVYLKYLST